VQRRIFELESEAVTADKRIHITRISSFLHIAKDAQVQGERMCHISVKSEINTSFSVKNLKG
jgi:hypothetical protein